MWNPQKAEYLLRNILGSKVVKTNLKGLPYQLFCYQLVLPGSKSHTTPATLNSVSTENFPESVPNESNSEHSTAAEAQQIVKRKSRNRRKRSKIPKPNIEIKRVPHRSRNATPTEITTDDEDMITYDVEEEELEQDPFILPEGYLRALTPSRYRNYRE
ncbi:hypothetical protein TNCV_100021 [Trichonephila clavipes]|nr:hypothetical protein TNCV_100021 [Trichonephila clavipes]